MPNAELKTCLLCLKQETCEQNLQICTECKCDLDFCVTNGLRKLEISDQQHEPALKQVVEVLSLPDSEQHQRWQTVLDNNPALIYAYSFILGRQLGRKPNK